MKALISAFALLSFVAASTIPYVTPAQAQTQQTTPKKTTKSKKHVAKAKKVHKSTAKKKKPTSTPKAG